MKQYRKQSGITIIEIVISISILAIALTSLVSLFTSNSIRSAVPLVREQAVHIASAYMDMTLLHNYSDPFLELGTCEEGAGNRHNFDDVNDFNCINDTDGARDHLGNLIEGLEAFNVDINVTSTTLNGAPARRIEVLVTRDLFDTFNTSLVAYRMPF